MASAAAIFTPCVQSHAFDERKVLLGCDEVKIGRSVARVKPSPDNAIFDCKVLSRNHAVIWYEDQKFYLKDTKSSNGTFVNSQRLSKGSEESPPKEILSGDIIQFGVDIVENTKRVTHGCIIALVRLFHPDGTEVVAFKKDSPDSSAAATAPVTVMSSGGAAALSTQELYQLHQYLREAAHREQQLEQKLSTLQALILSTQDASESSWNALIDEDRLLSRIQLLESQLQLYSKNTTEDAMRDETLNLHRQKEQYENAAKESLRRALQEKVEAVQKLSDVERSLETTEEECVRLRDHCDLAQKELNAIMTQQTDALSKIQDLSQQLQDAEAKISALDGIVASERSEKETAITQLSRQEAILKAKIESLQADKDFTEEQLAALKVRVEQMAEKDEDSLAELRSLHDEVSKAKDDVLVRRRGAEAVKDKLRLSDDRLASIIQQAVDSLAVQLEESVYQRMKTEELVRYLNDFAKDLEKGLKAAAEAPVTDGDSGSPDESPSPEDGETRLQKRYEVEIASLTGKLQHSEQLLSQTTARCQQLQETLQKQEAVHQKLAEERDVASENLEDFQRKFEEAAAESERYKNKLQLVTEELALEKSLKSTSSLDNDNARMTLHRQAAKNQAEFAVLKDECAKLRQRMLAVENEMKSSRKENSRLSSENRHLQQSCLELQRLKASLEDGQMNGRYQLDSAKYEVDTMRNQLNEAHEDAISLRKKNAGQERELSGLRKRLLDSGYDFDYEELALRVRTVTWVSAVPLLLLLFAFVVAFLPFFSAVTATTDSL